MNVMKRKMTMVASCLVVTIVALAQVVDTGVRIVDPAVQSLKVAPLGAASLPPVVEMGVGQIGVEFDYMDSDTHYLRYSVTHCDAHWQPSQLLESEYVDGFNSADITQCDYSQATFVHYCHYSFALPNEDLKLTRSGNYLLTVYEQDDPDRVLFQTRFSLYESLVDMTVNVTSNTDIDYNGEHQQVMVELGYKLEDIKDPYNELTLVVNQNTRTDDDRYITRPLMVEMGRATYDHTPALIFAAGNEFRRIETVNTRGYNLGGVHIEYFDPYYHATLPIDQPRAGTQHMYDQTQFGHFTIRNSDADDSATEADYCVTHFVLDTGGPLVGGTLHLNGEFTQGMPVSSTQMTYDAASGMYVNDMLLKQGAYNYQYLWIPSGSTVGQTAKIEGDKYQTINRYFVRVYYRPMGERYDRLVGYGVGYSL